MYLSLAHLGGADESIKRGYLYVQLYFDADRFVLTREHEVLLRNLISKSLAKGEIWQIQIAAWPVHNALKEFSESIEVTSLGDKRENEVKTFLRIQYPSLYVPNVNMADDPAGLMKFSQFTNISNHRLLVDDWLLDTGSYFPKADQVGSKAIVFVVLKGP